MKRIFILLTTILSILLVSCCNDSPAKEVYNFENEIEQGFDELEKYVDVSYFVNLSKKLVMDDVSPCEYKAIEQEQFEIITETVTAVFSDMDEESKEALNELACEDDDIKEFLVMIENGFEDFQEEDIDEFVICSLDIYQTNDMCMSLNNTLINAGLSMAAVKVFIASFKTFFGAIKAVFLTPKVRTAIIVGSVVALGVVTIINYYKINPIFHTIVDIFVNAAKSFANTIVTAFQNLFAMASAAVTVNSFADVAAQNPDLKEELDKLRFTMEDLENYATKMLGVTVLSQFLNPKDRKKILVIGRDISESLDELGLTDNVAYNVVASRFNGFAFFNIKYGTFSKETSKEFMKLLNRFIVHYCAANDWTFVLATNPYYYIEEHLDTEPYGGESYAMELTIIRSYGYNRFADGLTWETIPCPGTEKIAYFKPSCHVVEKSKLQKV